MKLYRFLIIAGLLIFACGTALADVNVYFDPADSYHGVGSSFKIDVLANIAGDPGLVAFGFNLVWDPSLMQLNDVGGAGSPWDILWDSASITGLLFPTETSPVSVFGSGILLANLYFTCLGEGSSTLGITVDSTDGLQGFYGPDPNADPLAGSGPLLDFTVTDGTVDQGAAAVPEPSSILLLSAAVLGLAYWTKRK